MQKKAPSFTKCLQNNISIHAWSEFNNIWGSLKLIADWFWFMDVNLQNISVLLLTVCKILITLANLFLLLKCPSTFHFQHRKQLSAKNKAFGKLLSKVAHRISKDFHIQQQSARWFYHERIVHSFHLASLFGTSRGENAENSWKKPWWWLNKFSLRNDRELRNEFQFA